MKLLLWISFAAFVSFLVQVSILGTAASYAVLVLLFGYGLRRQLRSCPECHSWRTRTRRIRCTTAHGGTVDRRERYCRRCSVHFAVGNDRILNFAYRD